MPTFMDDEVGSLVMCERLCEPVNDRSFPPSLLSHYTDIVTSTGEWSLPERCSRSDTRRDAPAEYDTLEWQG